MPCETRRLIKPKIKPKPKAKDQTKKKVIKLIKKRGWTFNQISDYKFTATKPYTKDKIDIEFLESGMVKITVPGQISAANHLSAESLVNEITQVVGGMVTLEHLHGKSHTHTHAMHA